MRRQAGRVASLGVGMDNVLVSGIVALGGVIAVLWRTITANHLRTISKLDECEKDRETLHRKIGGLTVRIDDLENTVKEV